MNTVARTDHEGPQGDLFGSTRLPAIKPISWKDKDTDQAFADFHDANPHVYVAFVRMARSMGWSG